MKWLNIFKKKNKPNNIQKLDNFIYQELYLKSKLIDYLNQLICNPIELHPVEYTNANYVLKHGTTVTNPIVKKITSGVILSYFSIFEEYENVVITIETTPYEDADNLVVIKWQIGVMIVNSATPFTKLPLKQGNPYMVDYTKTFYKKEYTKEEDKIEHIIEHHIDASDMSQMEHLINLQ